MTKSRCLANRKMLFQFHFPRIFVAADLARLQRIHSTAVRYWKQATDEGTASSLYNGHCRRNRGELSVCSRLVFESLRSGDMQKRLGAKRIVIVKVLLRS